MYVIQYKEMRSALRAGIQMGGAWVAFAWPAGRLPFGGGILTASGRHEQMHCFNHSKEAPRSGIAERRRRLMSKGSDDGDHGEDGR